MKEFKNKEAFKRFLNSQIEEIKKYQEQEIKKTGRKDLQNISKEWIKKNAHDFREKYECTHPEDIKND